MTLSLIKPLTVEDTYSSQEKGILNAINGICTKLFGNILTEKENQNTFTTNGNRWDNRIENLNRVHANPIYQSTSNRGLKKILNGLRNFTLGYSISC